jgi:hypothetical protein
VTRAGITGHRGLNPTTTNLIDSAIRDVLTTYDGHRLVGVTNLADGADSIFAQAVLDHGGTLHVIVPAKSYRAELPTDHHATYDALLDQATTVERLDFTESTSEAHMAASLRMIDTTSELIAVWDGRPARGHGGTADVVAAARERGRPVRVVWPPGATRGAD